ncbi:MAG: hypothetical protein U0Q12_16165 [Vicinamibacterales bacterium]
MRRWTRAASVAASAAIAVTMAARAEAAGKWTSVQSEHFTLVGDASDRHLRNVALRLEQFREVFERALPNTRSLDTAPTVVVVFESNKSMRPVKPVRDGKVQDWVSGLFAAGVDVNYILLTVEADERAYPLVFSGYSHVLLSSALQGAPLWVSNGLSEYYSTFVAAANGKGATLGKVPQQALDRARSRWLPLQTVLNAPYDSPLYRTEADRSTFDAVCWAAVHYLLDAMPNGGENLGRYLGMASTTGITERSFHDAFGIEIPEFEKQVQEYVLRSVFRTRIASFDEKLSADRPDTVETLTAAQVDARMADVFLHLDRIADAEPLVDRAIAADATQAQPYLTRALLRERQQRTEEAWTDFERAAELGQDSFPAQQAFGRFAVAQFRGGTLNADRRPRYEKARAALARAVVLQPESGESQFLLGFASLLLSDLDKARQASEKALELAPTREEYRLLVAQVAVQQRDVNGARRALGALAARASTPERIQRARALLADIASVETRVREDQERAKAEQAAADKAATEAASPFGDAGTRASGYQLQLRSTRDGEVRGLGAVTTIECRPKGIVFQTTLDGRAMRLVTKTFDTVELITYRDAGGQVACGPQADLDHVYVTWRAVAADVAKGVGGADGEIVAIELLPRDYKPQ